MGLAAVNLVEENPFESTEIQKVARPIIKVRETVEVRVRLTTLDSTVYVLRARLCCVELPAVAARKPE
jgi:hypothetical protein